MAKMQKATLDPSKISGYCGRLKCCLRYEDKTYTELKKQLPKKRSIAKTRYGQGTIVDTQILTQLVMVELGDGTKIAVPLEELEIVSPPQTKAAEKPDTSPEDADHESEDTKDEVDDNQAQQP